MIREFDLCPICALNEFEIIGKKKSSELPDLKKLLWLYSNTADL
jgi:hypothetical protein